MIQYFDKISKIIELCHEEMQFSIANNYSKTEENMQEMNGNTLSLLD
jgi:hypothetical protein